MPEKATTQIKNLGECKNSINILSILSIMSIFRGDNDHEIT